MKYAIQVNPKNQIHPFDYYDLDALANDTEIIIFGNKNYSPIIPRFVLDLLDDENYSFHFQGYSNTMELVEFLKERTHEAWTYTTIYGNAQDEWQYIVYKMNAINIADLEYEYFNLGTEWQICDSPEAENGNYFYAHCESLDDTLEEMQLEYPGEKIALIPWVD